MRLEEKTCEFHVLNKRKKKLAPPLASQKLATARLCLPTVACFLRHPHPAFRVHVHCKARARPEQQLTLAKKNSKKKQRGVKPPASLLSSAGKKSPASLLSSAALCSPSFTPFGGGSEVASCTNTFIRKYRCCYLKLLFELPLSPLILLSP